MDIVFADKHGAAYATGPAPLHNERELLHATFGHAARRATQLGKNVLASFTQLIGPHDPLAMFCALRQLELGGSIYWELPAEKRAFAGAGIAITIETSGTACYRETAEAWKEVRQEAVIGYTSSATPRKLVGPVLLGGFAFDPLAPHTQLWEGFPDGLLTLPRFLFKCSEEGSVLTINRLIEPEGEIEPSVEEDMNILLRLRALLERQKDASQEDKRPESASIRNLLPAETWKELVAETVKKIQRGDYKKVVLARGVEVTTPQVLVIEEILQQLRTNYPMAYVFAIQRGSRHFVAATPERLIRAQDGQVRTMALAGSAPRGKTVEEDNRLGVELLQSSKNKIEHEIVAATIREALEQVCSHVWMADAPKLLQLKNIQHLETPIVGELRPQASVLEALQGLHPTPAVGGFPRDKALAMIREHEQLDRGWYVGPVGWIDAYGNGDFAVALRSALIDGNIATLFAGGGIVADSNPESEFAETCSKLEAILYSILSERANGHTQ